MTEKYLGRELPPITSTEAIAEAMVWAYAQNFKLTRRSKRIFSDIFDQTRGPIHEKVQSLTTALTQGLCEINSTYVLCFLFQNYPQLFNRYCLLESRVDTDEPQFRNTEFRNTDWYRHVCFLVRDIHDVYHAGSPANYDTGKGQNSLNQVFSSADLTEVLIQIKASEGGVWPSTKFIKHTLQNNADSIAITRPQDTPDALAVHTTTISRQLGKKKPRANNEKHYVPILPNSQFFDPTTFCW